MSRLTKKFNDNSGYEIKEYGAEFNEVKLNAYLDAVDKLGKLEDLEEELGCPLEVVIKALKEGIYQSDGGRRKYPTIEYNGATKKFYFAFGTYCNVEDYKKTWWLKEDKRE